MKAICEYCRSIGLSSAEVSVLQMIREFNFPAKKLGGIWESDKDLIIGWRKKYVAGENTWVNDKKDKKKSK